ncbi:hypothetical protein [Aliiglaciecola sp. NS0011-25]
MNFNLTDILVLFIIAAIAFQFWRIRGISEQAKVYLEKILRNKRPAIN